MVLFVDDEENVMKALQRTFHNEPYPVSFASSGREGLELLTRLQDVAVIVSDQRMQEMDGTEFLTRSRELAPDAVRMLLTGYSDFQAAIDAMNNGGISRYISKPWNDKELLKLVRDAVYEYERKLKGDFKVKNQLLANLSHELRTPLGGVLGGLQLMEMTDLDEEQLSYIAMVKSSAEEELFLVNSLLEVTRLQSEELMQERKPCQICQCVDEVCAAYRQAIKDKGLFLTVTVAPETRKTVLTDKALISRILSIFIGNALKFTSTGGITVSCREHAQCNNFVIMRLGVADTGIGIASDKRSLIFRGFTQADMSDTRTYGGIGLGLMTSRILATALGGHVWAESVPDGGSLFQLELPLELYQQHQAL